MHAKLLLIELLQFSMFIHRCKWPALYYYIAIQSNKSDCDEIK